MILFWTLGFTNFLMTLAIQSCWRRPRTELLVKDFLVKLDTFIPIDSQTKQKSKSPFNRIALFHGLSLFVQGVGYNSILSMICIVYKYMLTCIATAKPPKDNCILQIFYDPWPRLLVFRGLSRLCLRHARRLRGLCRTRNVCAGAWRCLGRPWGNCSETCLFKPMTVENLQEH